MQLNGIAKEYENHVQASICNIDRLDVDWLRTNASTALLDD